MKLGKISLVISAAACMVLNASAQVYNTGYSTSLNSSNQLVDNLWTITALANTPSGSSFPAVPYAAFVLPSATITWPWDLSAPPVGAPNNLTTQWDSNLQPAFGAGDTNGMITTYTLNFNAPVGSYALYFECDNYLDMYLGAISLPNRFLTESSSNPGDFLGWHNTTVNVATAGANQLNIVVYNFPFPTGNYTGLRVNFSVPVPEPSSMVLMAGGLVALLAAAKRRKQ
jgi:PEP-CTERM motif